jgi:hypothetical protein
MEAFHSNRTCTDYQTIKLRGRGVRFEQEETRHTEMSREWGKQIACLPAKAQSGIYVFESETKAQIKNYDADKANE